MMKRMNCWEFQECGREPGGFRVDELGICPVATYTSLDGVNGGTNGGRICWTIAGTYSMDKAKHMKGLFARTISSCFHCKFHTKVLTEEGLFDKEDAHILVKKKGKRAHESKEGKKIFHR